MQIRRISHGALGALALGLLLVASSATAFHDGSVGQCESCHVMHGTNPGAYLLAGSDSSSVCLNCHGGGIQREYTVLTTNTMPGTPPINYGPAGDFAWVGKNFTWLDRKGGIHMSPGEEHGHNVVASQFGLFRDVTHSTAPGGLYPSDKLSCISCHDPHGRYRVSANGLSTSSPPTSSSGSYGAQPAQSEAVGVYRLLAGGGYVPRSIPLAPAFLNNPPIAVAPLSWNRNERLTQTRVAYGSGMSEWCANCHGQLHTPFAPPSASSFMHPSGNTAKLAKNRISNVYNAYVKTGDLSGTLLTSYSSLVPYEEGSTDTLALARHANSDGSNAAGPSTGSENVMCLSCHRAHASGWDHGLRWNAKSDAVVVGGQWPGIDATGNASEREYAQGRTTAETRAAMYEREPTAFASFQTSLCNKCHAK
jgi:predicted CXXCH cytochrome family protein